MSKLSTICAVMNRETRVIPFVRSWLEFKMMDELVIIDWSSIEPVEVTLAKENLRHPKIKIIRVDNKEFFSLGKSYNMAAAKASGDFVMKVDIDHILTNPELLTEEIDRVGSDEFLVGGGAGAYYCGICYLPRASVMYDEKFEGYGYDDLDMYLRLQQSGLTKGCFHEIKKYIYHIPHDDNMRVCNYEEKDKARSTHNNQKRSSTHE